MTYILRVIGDSMIDEYPPPRHDFVDPEVPACHGDDVIALMHDTGETTFKRLIEDGTQRYLKALNPNWPEPYIKINGNCSIIGTVIFSGKPKKIHNKGLINIYMNLLRQVFYTLDNVPMRYIMYPKET